MDTAKQIATVAKELGIGRHLECPKCGTQFEATAGKEYKSGVFCPECRERGYTLVGICHVQFEEGFDPINDLNDMQKVKKLLTEDAQQRDFIINLFQIVTGHPYIPEKCWPRDVFKCSVATGAQQLEAVLKTIGKWEE